MKSNPFSRGFSVTSGPKVYKESSKLSSKNDHSSLKQSVLHTPEHSVLSKGAGKEIISENYLNDLYEQSEKAISLK